MANENDNQGGFEGKQSEFDKQKQDETGQQGQQGQQSQTGQQQQPIGGQQGQQSEFGQQGQADTQVDDPTGQQGQTGQTGGGQQGGPGGFVGSQGEETSEYLQEDKTKQAGFAEQGRGAPEQGSDIEGGGESSTDRSTDIEGSSGNR